MTRETTMPHHIDRRTLLAGMAGVAVAPASAQDANAVSIYTSNNQQAVQAITDEGRKALAGLKLNFITGGSGQFLRRMEAEAARPQADVFWSSSANTLGAFKQLYEPYASPQLTAIAPNLRDPANLWTASNLHVVVLMVNANQLGGQPAPKTWTDLFNPAFKGKVIIADPANSSTGYTILWGVRQMLGAEGLRKLAANINVTSQAPTVLRGVAQGEFTVGLTFESNAYAYVAGGQREISLVYPSDGTFTSPEFLVLAKNAPNPAGAKRVFDHIVSKEVQVALLEAAYRRPSRTDIDVAKIVKLPNVADIKVFAINEDEAAAKRTEFLAEWTAAVAAAK
jgi:iron(III) transport system substrate-binding protein